MKSAIKNHEKHRHLPVVVEILALTIAILLIAIGLGLVSSDGKRTACSLEAMLCPDGSAVGRTGPDCSFAPCPGIETVE